MPTWPDWSSHSDPHPMPECQCAACFWWWARGETQLPLLPVGIVTGTVIQGYRIKKADKQYFTADHRHPVIVRLDEPRGAEVSQVWAPHMMLWDVQARDQVEGNLSHVITVNGPEVYLRDLIVVTRPPRLQHQSLGIQSGGGGSP